METILILLCLLTFTRSQVLTQQTHFEIEESLFLDYPLVNKDFQQWQTFGSAVIHKNKVVLAPEAKDKKGLLISKSENPYTNFWILELEASLGNSAQTLRGGTGMAVYYVSSLDQVQEKSSIFGYQNVYHGVGVFFNTILVTSGEGDQLLNPVQGYFDPGNEHINVFLNKKNICYRSLRNYPEGVNLKIRLQYEHPFLIVSIFNQNNFEYDICFTMEADLQFNGYFVISGASGMQKPDYQYLHSLKLYNMRKTANNDHFLQARRKKAEYEDVNNSMEKAFIDFLQGKSKEEAGQNHQNLDELYEKIPKQHLQLMQQLRRSQETLEAQQNYIFNVFTQSLPNASYFEEALGSLQDVQMVLFNISMSLEKQTDDLSQLEQTFSKQKKKSGKSKSIERKELKNSQTQKLSSQLNDLLKKNEKLATIMSDLESEQNTLKRKLTQFDFDDLSKDNSYDGNEELFDLDEIDRVFEDLQLEADIGGGQSFLQILVNFGMICVIVASAVIWYKLNKLYSTYRLD